MPVITAPANEASVRFVPRKSASTRSARERFAPPRFAPVSTAAPSRAPARFAPTRFAPSGHTPGDRHQQGWRRSGLLPGRTRGWHMPTGRLAQPGRRATLTRWPPRWARKPGPACVSGLAQSMHALGSCNQCMVEVPGVQTSKAIPGDPHHCNAVTHSGNPRLALDPRSPARIVRCARTQLPGQIQVSGRTHPTRLACPTFPSVPHQLTANQVRAAMRSTVHSVRMQARGLGSSPRERTLLRASASITTGRNGILEAGHVPALAVEVHPRNALDDSR